MVCVPCFIIPVLLYIFHKFIQPFILRFWNPWKKTDSDGNDIKTDSQLFLCKDGVCSFAAFGHKSVKENQVASTTGKQDNANKDVDDVPIDKKHN